MGEWRLQAGTKQTARLSSSSSNKNSILERVQARRSARGKEREAQRRARRERREAEQSQGPSAADNCSSEREEEDREAGCCDGADVRGGDRSVQLDLEDSEEDETSDAECSKDEVDSENGCGFVDDEAEEDWSSDEEMDWTDSECEESGEEEEEESGFVLEEAREKGVRSQRRRPLELDSEDTEEGGREEVGSRESSEVPGSSGSGSEEDAGSESMAESGSEGLPGHLRWKEGLAQRAREGFERRRSRTANLQRLIYSDAAAVQSEEGTGEDGEGEEVGGLFHVARRQQLSVEQGEDCSVQPHRLTRDWGQCVPVVKSLFVTGSWGEEDAAALLHEDKESGYGDFEDLETGEKYGTAGEGEEDAGEKEEERVQKKKDLKVGVGTSYYNVLI